MALMVEIKLLKLVCANTGVDQNFEEMNAILCRPIEAKYIYRCMMFVSFLFIYLVFVQFEYVFPGASPLSLLVSLGSFAILSHLPIPLHLPPRHPHHPYSRSGPRTRLKHRGT